MRRFNKLRKACALVLSLAALTLGSAMSVLAEEPAKLVSAAEPVLKVSQTLSVTNNAPDSALAVPYTLTAAGDTDTAEVQVDGNRWSGSISFSLSGSEEKSWKLAFGKPGVYTFELKQNLSDAEKSANSLYSFDSTVYTIRAYVKNDGNGGLFTEITAQKGSDTSNKVDAIVFGNTYTKTSTGGRTTGGGSGSGGGGGTTTWHSVTPQGSEESGQVLGANRGPVGEIIEAVAEGPVGQVLGATRKAVQTGDSSMMVIMGLGFVACVAAFVAWEWRIFHKEKSETN